MELWKQLDIRYDDNTNKERDARVDVPTKNTPQIMVEASHQGHVISGSRTDDHLERLERNPNIRSYRRRKLQAGLIVD